MRKNLLRISEIFGPTLQGEGQHIGEPTIFIRSGGCDYRCEWCDTLYAVKTEFKANWKQVAKTQIVNQVKDLSSNKPMLITLSGGNPAIQPFSPLITTLQQLGYTVTMETQGSISKDWFSRLDSITFSPKPPSSKMPFDESSLDSCLESSKNISKAFKFVILDQNDLRWSYGLSQKYPSIPTFLQPCYLKQPKFDHKKYLQQLEKLTQSVLKLKWFNATVLPQLHLLLWEGKSGH